MRTKKVVTVIDNYVFKDEKLWWYIRDERRLTREPYINNGPDAATKAKIIKEAVQHLEGDKSF